MENKFLRLQNFCRPIRLLISPHCNLTDLTVKCHWIQSPKKVHEASNLLHSIYASRFSYVINVFLELIEIICDRKFNTLDSHSCLSYNFPHFLVGQQMTDINLIHILASFYALIAHLIFVERARPFFAHSSAEGRITSLAISL